jgi:hypothetical protein
MKKFETHAFRFLGVCSLPTAALARDLIVIAIDHKVLTNTRSFIAEKMNSLALQIGFITFKSNPVFPISGYRPGTQWGVQFFKKKPCRFNACFGIDSIPGNADEIGTFLL